jgi:hypothetical protein
MASVIAANAPGGVAMNSVSRNPLERLPGLAPRTISTGLLFKGTKDIADGLVASQVLRREYVLEMQHLDPKWMTALYVRTICLGVILGFRAVRN